MKIKKFTLTRAENVISRYKLPETFANDTFYPDEAKTISIYLVEFKTEANPSDIVIDFQVKGNSKIIPLSVFKTEMVYTNNIYSWNTSKEEYFTFGVNDFKIVVDGIAEDFVINFYYSIAAYHFGRRSHQ